MAVRTPSAVWNGTLTVCRQERLRLASEAHRRSELLLGDG